MSNSTVFGRGYLDHVAEDIQAFLGSLERVLFFPFALFDRDKYVATARARFATLGYQIDSAHERSAPLDAVAAAEAIFIGGGNTFRLLKSLEDLQVMDAIRAKVSGGTPYIGSSAGSIVAGPSIKTTKDMPIVQPHSFEALGLVRFQISPHFLDPDPNSTHMGETQEERINQFLEENDAPVVGVREGAWLVIANGRVTLKGSTGARIFRRAHAAIEAQPGTDISGFVGGA